MRHELITFGIANQRFGIDIMTVREIRAWSPVTRLPRVPGYVAGVVNLRGAVRPFADKDVTVFAEAHNLTDEEAREHTSFLKDIAPLPGRNLRIGVSYAF